MPGLCRISRVLLVTILSDRSVVCSLLTPPSSIGSACLELQLRLYQKVSFTIHDFGLWKTKQERVKLSCTVQWKRGILYVSLPAWLSVRSETHWELENMSKICICKHYQQHPTFVLVHNIHRGWMRAVGCSWMMVIGWTNKPKLCEEGGLLQCYLILPHLGQGPSSSKISRHI